MVRERFFCERGHAPSAPVGPDSCAETNRRGGPLNPSGDELARSPAVTGSVDPPVLLGNEVVRLQIANGVIEPGSAQPVDHVKIRPVGLDLRK